jgi:hypothetical protein
LVNYIGNDEELKKNNPHEVVRVYDDGDYQRVVLKGYDSYLCYFYNTEFDLHFRPKEEQNEKR